MELSDIDKKIIVAMQDQLPVVPEPVKAVAEGIGMTEELLLSRLQAMKEAGALRKLGAVLRHRQVGMKANVLCVWQVPEQRLGEVAEIMCSIPAVTHCYDRNTAPNWPYNFYTMIHGSSREECEAIANQLAQETGLTQYEMLFTGKEWKKPSMNYFC